MPDPQTLAQAVRDAAPLLVRYLAGFDEANRTRQAPGLANHAAWTMGHLALCLHRGAESVSGVGAPLPAADFIQDADAGDGARFATESVGFGSVPTDDPARYPSWVRCRAIFDSAADRFVRTIVSSDGDRLMADVAWGSARVTAAALVTRQIIHVGVHTGQLIDLRRALGMPTVVG